MPRNPKYTVDFLISTTIELIENNGIEAVTARALGKRLNTAPTTIFTHFDSLDDIKKAAVNEIKKKYIEYISESNGDKSYISFACRLVEYAKEHKNLFICLFANRDEKDTIYSFLALGNLKKDMIRSLPSNCTELDLKNVCITAFALASLNAYGVLNSSKDEVISYMPNESTVKKESDNIKETKEKDEDKGSSDISEYMKRLRDVIND